MADRQQLLRIALMDPFIHAGMLAPGAHVTTFGADEPGKAEVVADVFRAALFVCDDRALAVEMGALGGVGLAFQDAAPAWAAYEGARTRGVGREVDILA